MINVFVFRQHLLFDLHGVHEEKHNRNKRVHLSTVSCPNHTYNNATAYNISNLFMHKIYIQTETPFLFTRSIELFLLFTQHIVLFQLFT